MHIMYMSTETGTRFFNDSSQKDALGRICCVFEVIEWASDLRISSEELYPLASDHTHRPNGQNKGGLAESC